MRDDGWWSKSKSPTRIDTNIYKTPLAQEPDNVAISVLNLSKREAEYVREFARQLQIARGKSTYQIAVTVGDRIERPSTMNGSTGSAGATGYIDRGVVPPGWIKSYNVMRGRQELTAPNGAKFYLDPRNGNELVQIDDPFGDADVLQKREERKNAEAKAKAKRDEQRALDPTARFSGLELNDE